MRGAVITEGSVYCFGGGGEVGYSVVCNQANGSWQRITGGAGIATFFPAMLRLAGPIWRSAAPVSASRSRAGTGANTSSTGSSMKESPAARRDKCNSRAGAPSGNLLTRKSTGHAERLPGIHRVGFTNDECTGDFGNVGSKESSFERAGRVGRSCQPEITIETLAC